MEYMAMHHQNVRRTVYKTYLNLATLMCFGKPGKKLIYGALVQAKRYSV